MNYPLTSAYKPDPSIKDAFKNVNPDGSVNIESLLQAIQTSSTHREVLVQEIEKFRSTGQMSDYLKKSVKVSLYFFTGAPVVPNQQILKVDFKKMKLKVMLPFVKPPYGIQDSISVTKLYLMRIFGPNWEIQCDIIPKNDDQRPASPRRRKKVKPQRASRTKKNRKRSK